MTREEAFKLAMQACKETWNEKTCAEIIKALSQEPKYCDRNICLRNEYNGIGCDECEVTKSQEPSGDLIQRQAVIDAIDKWVKSMHVLVVFPANEVTPLFDSIHDLPSVNPQPCEDAISREELLKAIAYKIWTSTESVGDDYKYIKSVSKPTGIEFDEEQEQHDFVQSHKSIPVKLKVEPSGDLISRQEAIKAIDEKAKRIKNEDTLNGLAGAVGILFDLPSYNSINSELSEDAIYGLKKP